MLSLPPGRDHYRVFTPYWRRWQALPLRDVLPAPARVQLPPGLEPGELPTLRSLTSRGTVAGAASPAASAQARDRLARAYAATRARALSAHLHFGCVSPVEVAARMRDQPEAAMQFLRQLCWRDFFLQLLAANPSLPREDLRPRRDRWRDDDGGARPLARGQRRAIRSSTPACDSSRARAGSATARASSSRRSSRRRSIRTGASAPTHFARLLVDADVANNVGNWQWMAGTGADTRPNRVLNPVRQAKRHDPDGAYVRRYVPELADVDAAYVHEPWKAPAAAAPRDYPPPIDHVDAAAA